MTVAAQLNPEDEEKSIVEDENQSEGVKVRVSIPQMAKETR